MELGESRLTFYFDVHGEVNMDKTIELARERTDELGVGKVIVASKRVSASRVMVRKRVMDLLEEGVIEKAEGFDYRLIERHYESMECLETPQRIISCFGPFSWPSLRP
jgi:hypothetical protein